MLHRYHVRIKGVEDNPLPEPEVTIGNYEKGEDSECLIYLNSNLLNSDSDASSLPNDEVSIETQTADESMHEGEASVIPLWRSN